MFNEKGEPCGVFCLGYDITEFIHKSAALEQMSYIQSHVIRKPIANLVGLMNLLNQQVLTKEQELMINMIKQEVDELDHYMRNSTT